GHGGPRLDVLLRSTVVESVQRNQGLSRVLQYRIARPGPCESRVVFRLPPGPSRPARSDHSHHNRGEHTHDEPVWSPTRQPCRAEHPHNHSSEPSNAATESPSSPGCDNSNIPGSPSSSDSASPLPSPASGVASWSAPSAPARSHPTPAHGSG